MTIERPVGGPHFRKPRGTAPRGTLQYEAASLAWLGQVPDGAPAVEVLSVDDDLLVEVDLPVAEPTTAMAEDFGRRLAHTHLAGAAGFGAAPDGWRGDGFLAGLPLPLLDPPQTSWGRFHAAARLRPVVRQAVDQAVLAPAGAAAVEAVCQRLEAGEFEDGRAADRIHGDLWAGNVVFTPDGGVLIDAAAHGGHGETDLAMLDLFGAPHLPRLRAAWAEVYQPASGWRERTALHQLHPLLVHAVLFGGGYGHRAAELARRYA
ncbi:MULTISPECIES: fructosamine kinase family protein [unclassified Luteococcus]|uniref:fructosamine kinase family protein n=1 Tax=unclassified Luteococcus TaxID=2639923 RepID=UPI00313B0E8D